MSAQLALPAAQTTMRTPASLELPFEQPLHDEHFAALQRELAAALHSAGLDARLHIETDAGAERAIFVKFRRHCEDVDRALLANLLTHTGWALEFRTSWDTQALVHVFYARHDDGARIALIVSTAYSPPTTKETPR